MTAPKTSMDPELAGDGLPRATPKDPATLDMFGGDNVATPSGSESIESRGEERAE